MISGLLKKIFGSRNDRLVRQYMHTVRKINALEARGLRAVRRGAARQDRGVPAARGRRRVARRAAARSLRRGARGRQAGARHAPLRRPARRRHGAAQRQDRRDAHRRGQDPGRHAARLPQRAVGQGRARHHGERLPRQPRCRVDGPHLRLPRADHRLQPVAHVARPEAGRLRRRHHLRHQQRVRLRLPARQHGVCGRRARAARAQLRDRRRGGLHPDRRGAHAADHLRPGRGPHRAVPQDEPGCADAQASGGRPRRQGRGHRGGRLHGRPQGAPGAADRGRATRPPSRSSCAWACSPRAAGSTIPATSCWCITSTPRCAPTPSTTATSSTWCRTARSSSSTSSPAA